MAAGANLIHLARDYCRDRSNWREIVRINQLTEPYPIIRATSIQGPLSLLIVKKLSATVNGPGITVMEASEGAVFQLALPKEVRAFNEPETLPCG